MTPGTGDASPYVLRAKAPLLVTSQSNIDVEIQNRGSVDWNIRPASLVCHTQLFCFMNTDHIAHFIVYK